MSKPDPMKDKTDRLQYLGEQLVKKQQEMARERIAIQPGVLENVRYEMFINEVLGRVGESEQRMDFEIRVIERQIVGIENTLKDARKSSNVRKLHVPGRD